MYLAINRVRRRLQDTFGESHIEFNIWGAPTDLAGAKALKNLDPFQFEWWAVDLVEAHEANDRRKGADSGIDGYINFFEVRGTRAKKLIIQVKSGHVGVHHIRDLKGTMERESASIGVLITLEPTAPMVREAAATGIYQSEGLPGRYPKVQIVTIAELLDGKTLEYPRFNVEGFPKAERQTKDEQKGLF